MESQTAIESASRLEMDHDAPVSVSLGCSTGSVVAVGTAQVDDGTISMAEEYIKDKSKLL